MAKKILLCFLVFCISGIVSAQTASTTIAKKIVRVPFKLNLILEIAGEITKEYVRVGDTVSKGKLLLELDNSNLIYQKNIYLSSLDTEKLKLNQIADPNPLAITLEKVKLEKAQNDVARAAEDMLATIVDGYIKADDAVRDKVDQFFTNPKNGSPQVNFTILNNAILNDFIYKRNDIENVLSNWKAFDAGMSSDGDLENYFNTSLAYLNQVNAFLDTAAVNLNAAIPDTVNSAYTLRNWRTDVFTGRTNVLTAVRNLQTAHEKVQAAQSALVLEKNTLDGIRNVYSNDRIAIEKNTIAGIQYKIDALDLELQKFKLFTPISGRIVYIRAPTGTVVPALSTLVSIQPLSKTKKK